MSQHNHRFVEEYEGFLGFGLDPESDRASFTVYMQKFSDDDLMAVLRERVTNDEIDQAVDLVHRILSRHLSDDEYHELFLKEPHEH